MRRFVLGVAAAVCVWSCAGAADGVAKPRIIDGVQVPVSTFPTVGIFTDSGNSFVCTGTLIAPRFVLTAAHCVVNENTGVKEVGDTLARFKLGGTTFSSVKVTPHPSYHGDTSQEVEGAVDLAVIELSNAVPSVTPSPLNRAAPTVGTLLTLVGFGEQGTGAAGTNHTLPPNGTVVMGQSPIDIVTSTFVKWNFDNRQPPDKESNTAPGDSGGPQFAMIGGVLTLVSVTSGGRKANSSFGDLSYNTRVDIATDWIDSLMGIPVISSALTASGTAGSAFSYTITASNTPTSFSVTGLPAEFTFNNVTGVIEGTPASAGIFSVIIGAVNANGSALKTLVVNVAPGPVPAPVITSALSVSGTQGLPFSYAITATNSPTVFTATGLPSGLSLNGQTGVISGAPLTAGAASVQISAGNLGGTDTNTLALSIAANAPIFSSAPAAAPNPVPVGQPVTLSANASGAVTYAWSFGDGTADVGASVSHVYSPAKDYAVTVTAINSVNISTVMGLTVTVNAIQGGGAGNTVSVGEIDSDGDGFSDTIENAAQTNPQDAASAPVNGKPVSAALATTSLKLSKKNVVTITGTLHVPADFVTSGKLAIADLGGFTQRFELNARGSGKSGKNTFALTVKAKKRVVFEQDAKFKLVLNAVPAMVTQDSPLTVVIGGTVFLKK